MEKVGDWKEWGMHVLHELQRLRAEQHVMNTHIVDLLAFKVETKTGAKVSAILISSIFGLVSLAVSIFVALHGLK